jgi:hypothetical protein
MGKMEVGQMISNSHNSRGSFSRARKQTSRWRTVFIALVVTLGIGGAAQPPPPTNVRFYIDVVAPKYTLCIGETVTYTMRVYRQFTSPPSGWTDKNLPDPYAVTGVQLEAHSSDNSVGTFKNNKASRALGMTGFGDVDFETAEFVFTAGKKPGKANLYFEGAVRGYEINTGYVTTTIPVKVVRCKYRVNTNSYWFYAGQYGTAYVYEFMNATLSGPAEGALTGNTRALWVGVNRIPKYGSTVNVNGGNVTLTGRRFESGDLEVTIDFGTITETEKNCGQAGCGGGDFSYSLIIKGTFPEAGGSRRVSQPLNTISGPMPGTTSITITPLEAK